MIVMTAGVVMMIMIITDNMNNDTDYIERFKWFGFTPS